MNPGQEKFYHFILERVNETHIDDAKALLAESFSLQSQGTFNQQYLMSFIPKMLGYLKPEHIDEVKNIMMKYKM